MLRDVVAEEGRNALRKGQQVEFAIGQHNGCELALAVRVLKKCSSHVSVPFVSFLSLLFWSLFYFVVNCSVLCVSEH